MTKKDVMEMSLFEPNLIECLGSEAGETDLVLLHPANPRSAPLMEGEGCTFFTESESTEMTSHWM